jgi:hypothetical protein
VRIRTAEPTAALAVIASRAQERGMELEGLSVSQPSLEDVYLQLAGGEQAIEPVTDEGVTA